MSSTTRTHSPHSSMHAEPIPAEDLQRAAETGRSEHLLHPLTGLWIMGLDLLLFGGTVVSFSTALVPLMFVGLVLGGLGTYVIQDHYSEDTGPKLKRKALFGGVVVGAPLPIAGTAVGSVVLAISGLSYLSRKLTGRR